MRRRGVYLPGDQSLFHALNEPLEWLGLRCQMHEGVGPHDLARILVDGRMAILEAGGHVIVVFSENADGTLVIGDPAMRSVEMDCPVTDYRLKGTGRIWVVWR